MLLLPDTAANDDHYSFFPTLSVGFSDVWSFMHEKVHHVEKQNQLYTFLNYLVDNASAKTSCIEGVTDRFEYSLQK
jgi:hypothetical protein